MIRIFYSLFLAIWVADTSHAACRDTGCQLDSWTSRGCEQYNMTETGQRNCENGIIFTCCDHKDLSSASKPVIPSACWETGCQLNSWAVKGCEQYGMVEVRQHTCENGIVFYCCEKNNTARPKSTPGTCWDTGCQLNSWLVKGCEEYGMVEIRQRPCKDGVVYSCCEKTNTKRGLKLAAPDCWDTGCQKDSWAVRGCEQYDKVEVKRQPCENGIVYSCCDNNSSSSGGPQSARGVCWDTGCQLNSWAVRGCEQYGMAEVKQQPCENGIVYSCCEKNDSPSEAKAAPSEPKPAPSESKPATSEPKPAPRVCWDTGCQLNNWAVRGCEQYDTVEVKQKPCENGIIYSCCEKNNASSSSGPKPAPPVCWDTGCQLNNWAVRGCEQYDTVEVKQKPCENGIIYSCCEKNKASSSEPKLAPRVCWDTGCQLDTWAVRGCEQYDKAEVKQQPCDGGIIYSCCDKNNSSNEPKSAPAPPVCWDTGCQLNSWAVRGCEQYDKVEVKQQPCENGIIYTCCDKNNSSNAPKSAPAPRVCWDTGCQLNNWAVRGCEQYDKVEVKQQPCENGIIYSCCDKNNSSNEPKSAPVPRVCWDTGCQLNSWAVRGCEQYDKVEIKQQPCDGGIIYSCCDKVNNSSSSGLKPAPHVCWDTGCQLDSWAVRGCEQYDKVEVKQQPCDGGIIYKCCDKSNSPSGGLKPAPRVCWDTGCQLDSWAVKGCEQYSKVEVKQKPCKNGIIYSCCDGNISSTVSSEPRSAPSTTCWDTGCQPNSWAVKGCEQYDMVETGQQPCENGVIYSCCSKNSVPDGLTPIPGTCFETDCQSHSWDVKGCQYNMIETGQKPCDYGLIYTCCIPTSDSPNVTKTQDGDEQPIFAVSNY